MSVAVEQHGTAREVKSESGLERVDVKTRWIIGVSLFALMIVGTMVALSLSQVQAFSSAANVGPAYQSRYYTLLTKSPGFWLIVAAPLLGILFGSMKAIRGKTIIENGRIRRNEATGVFLEHWTIAISCIVLLITGLLLGALFIPRLVDTPGEGGFLINTHLVMAIAFLFASFYHVTNHLRAKDMYRIRPRVSDVKDAVAHYLAMVGIGEAPEEEKYEPSQKLAYAGAATIAAIIIVTGAVKTLAHMVSLPGGLLAPMTFLHDLFAILMAVFFVVHIIMAAILPSSWPLLKSLFTGYVPEEYVAEHHERWYEEIQKGK